MVHVNQYNADPTGETDSTHAIRAAMIASFKFIPEKWHMVNGGIVGNIIFGAGVYKIKQNNALGFFESCRKSFRFTGAHRNSTFLVIEHDSSEDIWYLADSRRAQSIYSTLFENMTITCTNKNKFVLRHMAGDAGSDKQMWFNNCNLGYGGGASGLIDSYGIKRLIETSGKSNSDLTRVHNCIVKVEDCILHLDNSQSVDHRITASYLTTQNDLVQSIKGGSVSISDCGISVTNGAIFHFLAPNTISGGNRMFSATNCQMESVEGAWVKSDGPTLAKVTINGVNLSTGVSYKVRTIRVTSKGKGYTSAPKVCIPPPGLFEANEGATPAEATANIAQGVTAIQVTNGGKEYTFAPLVRISKGGGTGATAEAVISGGKVTRIDVKNSGSGYTSAPTVTICGGGATEDAEATATVSGVVDSITITNEGSGYTRDDFTNDGDFRVPIKIDGGGGTGAAAENRPTIDLVYIHAPGRVYINDCGEGIPSTDFRFTIDATDAKPNQAGGCIEMRGFTPSDFINFKKDKNRSVTEFLRILGSDSPSYISFDGATQRSTTDWPVDPTRQFGGLMITNRRAATIMPNTKSQFLLIKGEGEYWPDTRDSDNDTLSITFKLPAFTFLKGLYLHRPATSYKGLVSYQISLESTDGGKVVFAKPPTDLMKDVGWDVYVPINKMLRADTELRLRGSRAWRASPQDLLGCALLEIC